MKRALVIDDTKAVRIFLGKCLEEEGYSVISVGNGNEALKLMKQKSFDIIFMDMRLPNMGGMQILKRMKEYSIYIPVVVVTAYGTVNNVLECIDYGVIGYIEKPLSAERFKKYIADINKKTGSIKTYDIKPLPHEINNNECKETYHAPAARLADESIYKQLAIIKNKKVYAELFNVIPNIVLVLNKERQIIYSNSHFLELIGINNNEPNGLRPGEILNCIHAYEGMNGCGTTEYCSVCGAVNAILQAQRTKRSVQKECLMNFQSGTYVLSRELSILVVPSDQILEGATIFIVKDISDEKLRINMEKVFFHDLLNSAGAIKGLTEGAKKAASKIEKHNYISDIHESVDYMIEEINAHRLIFSTERNETLLNITEFSLTEVVHSLIKYYGESGCRFITEYQDNIKIVSDRAILYSVLMNMVKNAVETNSKIIKVRISLSGDAVNISVNNNSYMEREVQLQVFKKFFSTKDMGRGIGTYGMKLLGEGLLKGKVWFESTVEEGTTFTLQIPLVIG